MAFDISPWAGWLRLPPERLAPLAQELRALEAPPEALHILERLLHEADDPAPLASALAEESVQRALARLAYAAPFLLRLLMRRPAALGQGLLDDLPGDGALRPFRDYCAPAECPTLDEAALMAVLRRWKYDNLLRITARDLLGLQDTARTCRQMSDLADALIRVAYRYAFAIQVRRRGLPRQAGGGPAPGLVVGMGKLGGQELNYASDVDLIFVNGGSGPLSAPILADAPPIDPDEPPEAHWSRWAALAAGVRGDTPGSSSDEFHNQVVRYFTRLLAQKTEEGIGFRVDTDLRPMGRSGHLSPSIALVEDYYVTHGREWERTAMIKARPVEGNMALWERLAETLRPFVYRRYLDFGALEGVALIKHDINRQHGAGQARNLKLGRGGIRENEFFVQAQQLLHGGRRPALQVTNHARAVEELMAGDLLPQADGRAHLADYWCLRTRENRLQMVDEAQVQELPQDAGERLRVFHDFAPDFARRLPAAEAALAQARERVAERFAGLVRGTGEENYPQSDVWQAALRERLGEAPAQAALQRVNSLMTSLMRTRMGERCVFKLSRLLTLPALYRQGTAAGFPRWLEFAEQIGNRNAIYSLIEANPSIVDWIDLIFREGGVQARQLIRHPEFLESFLSLTGSGAGGPLPLLQGVLAQARDEEEFILELQMTKSQLVIQILMTYLHDPGSHEHRRLLSELADATITVCARHAWNTLVERLGLPEGAGADGAIGDFAVLAMGKLGSREMHFNSDLDLVFLYARDGKTSAGRSHYEFYTKLAQKLDSLLTSQTQFGRLYELDHRLRPFGAKGVLVPNLSAYLNFLGSEAEVWNFQALTRLRHLAGSAGLGQALLAATARAWRGRPRKRREVVAAVRHMLLRLVREHSQGVDTDQVLPLKYAVGGMIGFEFLRQCQFLVAQLDAPPGALPQPSPGLATAGAPHREASSDGDDAAAAARWTRPQEHEMITNLLPMYLDLSDLDERLALHVEHFAHRATAEMFDKLEAVRARWRFDEIRAVMRRMELGVLAAFDVLEAP
ncbi:MAG: hypothetical protein HY342_11595 [Candidatus Lambdaproteobacteria bacterium]|nr:hypothetical protein [Candidatus Lambdaproteobacteria bacterium]